MTRAVSTVSQRLSGELMDVQENELPYGIRYRLAGGPSGDLTSEIYEQLKDPDKEHDHDAEVSADALESLLLAMACEGIYLRSDRMVSAIKTAVDAIAQNLDDSPSVQDDHPFDEVDAHEASG